MKLCAFWGADQTCIVTGEKYPSCKNCPFYADKESVDKDRKKAALRMQELSYPLRLIYFQNYYAYLSKEERKKYYVHLWWNE